MAAKLLATGNRLMGDDGVAVKVAEHLKADLEQLGVEVIIGETDTSYIASQIIAGDYLLILDAMESGKAPGNLTVLPLERIKQQGQLAPHQSGIPALLLLCPFPVKGYLIGIEIAEVCLCLELSLPVAARFKSICAEVMAQVKLLYG